MIRDCDLITRVTNAGSNETVVSITVGRRVVQTFELAPGESRMCLEGEHPIPVFALMFRDVWIQSREPVEVECALLEMHVRKISGPIRAGPWVFDRSEMHLQIDTTATQHF